MTPDNGWITPSRDEIAAEQRYCSDQRDQQSRFKAIYDALTWIVVVQVLSLIALVFILITLVKRLPT